MGRFGDDTNPQRVDYATLHGLKQTTNSRNGAPDVFYFDSLIPFEPRVPGDELYKDQYMGLVVDGPFMNFNLFINETHDKYFVVIFGRTTPLRMDGFEHLCDKDKNWQKVTCKECGEEFELEDKEPHGDCPCCESLVHNPNFKYLEGNPEYELL